MADPFGITSITITGLKVAKHLHDLILDLHNAPTELLALSNEVCNLKFALDAIREAIEEQQGSGPGLQKFERFGPLLFHARVKLDQLSALMQKWAQLNRWGEVQIKKFDRLFWLRERSTVWDLQKQFKEIRSNLSVLLEASSLSLTTQLSVDVQSLYAVTTKTYNAHSTALTSISERVESLDTIRDTSRENTKLLQEIYGTVNQLVEQQLPVAQSRTSSYTTQSDDKQDNSSKARVRFKDEDEKTLLGEDYSGKTDHDSPLVLPVRRRASRPAACGSDCFCQCHARSRFQAFTFLTPIVGRLFLGYSGPLLRRQECNLGTCLQNGDKSTQLTYFFPRWFVDKVFTFSLVSSLGGPSFNIKVRKTVSETSNMFALSRVDGVAGIQEMFEERTGSPDDIDPAGGWTPLHFAVDHGSLGVCKLLLSNGADPNWEDNYGNSPTEIAWRNIMHLKASPQLADAFRVLFPGADYLNGRRFNQLHKLVIELEHGDLNKSIDAHMNAINSCDLDGWTPLHWAARRGNSEAVSLLLQNGADAFKFTGDNQRSPLHLAAMSNSTLCLQVLLNHRIGNKILDINAKDCYNVTPLKVGIETNSAAAVSYLIKAGADISSQVGRIGFIPLVHAVSEGIHQCVTLLLRAGADYRTKSHAGNSVLHLAAHEGDVKMLTLLAKGRMVDLDPEERNNAGETPSDILEKRQDPPEGIFDAFDRLLRSVTDDNFETGSWATSSMGESWHSFEETSWYEADALVQEDMAAIEEEADRLYYDERKEKKKDVWEPAPLSEENIAVRDMV